MNNIFFVYKTLRVSGAFALAIPSLTAFAVLFTGLSSVAQAAEEVDSQQLSETSVAVNDLNQLDTELTQIDFDSTFVVANQAAVLDGNASPQFPNAAIQEIASSSLAPVPGTVSTSSASLTPESELTFSPAGSQVAQADINFGRPTRGGRSYVGVAGNLGLGGGDSALGDGNFAAVSKIGLTNTFSIRPSAVFGNNTTILVPLTYDFSLQSADPFAEPLAIAPYVGVGAAIKTGSNSRTALLVSGGIDFPLTPRFTATASVNAGFFRQTDVGLLLGIGYNFTGF
ncbi:MAG: hypothetical protein MET45_15045 [Nostoc sp. LLA-1]|nr:hypothetical protein [Cyanocohniella sp. LLY]